MVVPVAGAARLRPQAIAGLALDEAGTGFHEAPSGQQTFAPVCIAVARAGPYVFAAEVEGFAGAPARQQLDGAALEGIEVRQRSGPVEAARHRVQGLQEIVA